MLGRRLLHYEIIEKLGEGGMGVVYKARDTHLQRMVAIKVLPPDKTADAERKRRFVQEARAASALNHSNIITIHDIASDGGIDFMVMEYVDGKGLDQLIPRKGLPSGQVLKYAVQIASALAKAHSAGIVHRDLKPGNIMVSPDDQVKVLDFGLAKLTETASAAEESTRSMHPQTEAGMIVGTVCYMSPEQAEGKPVDSRSDIFSFGAVMYEMITGHRAFQQETNASTKAAILRDEPKPISAVVPEVPRDLERVVARCLRKDSDRRYQTITDLRIALEDLKQESDSGKLTAAVSAPGVRSRWPRRWAFFVASGVLVASATVVGIFWLRGKKDAVRTAPEVKRVTFDSKLALHPAISLDGKYVAYASDRAGEGNLDIWVQTLPTGEPVRLTKDEANEDLPWFSPDGTKIAFRSEREGGGVYTIPVLGGEPRLLVRDASCPRYSPDGQLLLLTSSTSGGTDIDLAGAYLMPAEGGERRALLPGPEHVFVGVPVWSPDARRLIFRGSASNGPGGDWYTTPVAGGLPVLVQPSAQSTRFVSGSLPLAWLPNDRVLFSFGLRDAADLTSAEPANLWVARLSPDPQRIVGQPEQLTFGPSQIVQASVSTGGTAIFASTTARARLWDIPLGAPDISGKSQHLTTVVESEFDYWPSLSDTGRLAYVTRRSDKWDVRLRDLSSGKETLLANTQGGPYGVSTMVTRAGTRVAYSNDHGPKSAIYTVEPGGGTAEKLCEDCGQLRSWSSDGTVMLSQEEVFEGSKWAGERIDRIDARSGRKTVLLEKRGTFLFAPDLSPDSRWVVFEATVDFRKEQLFLAPMSNDGPVEPARWIAITDMKYFDAGPMWSRDGKILYFNSDRDGSTCLWAFQLDAATKKPLGEAFAVKHFHSNPRRYTLHPQFCVGRDRIIISLDQVQSDLWMMQLPE